MSKPDQNFISITPDGDQVLVNGFVTPATPDQFGIRHIYLDQLLPPDGTADTLKITGGISNLHVHVNRIHGGSEDCLDVNNKCRDVIVGDEKTVWVPRGKYVATIKGGSHRVEVRGILVGHGKEVSVDLGNWSDQSNDRTEGVYINLKTDDGSAISYRRLNATSPRLRASQRFVQKQVLPGSLRRFFVWVFQQLKKLKLA